MIPKFVRTNKNNFQRRKEEKVCQAKNLKGQTKQKKEKKRKR